MYIYNHQYLYIYVSIHLYIYVQIYNDIYNFDDMYILHVYSHIYVADKEWMHCAY